MPPPIPTGLRTGALLGVLLALAGSSRGQSYNFTSGPLPPCDTSIFTATVTGLNVLVDPSPWNWGNYLDNLQINITTDHPQTLRISLTSPGGTTLLLSAFNGAGGQNYTATTFGYFNTVSIAGAAAPFTGWWMPEGGGLDTFNGEDPNGTWTITVIDTACASGGSGTGGGNGWNPGWFNGSAGGGAFTFGFSSPPPPCIYDLGYHVVSGCPGDGVDMVQVMEGQWGSPLPFLAYFDMNTGATVPDPTNITVSGTYGAEYYDVWSGCIYSGTMVFILYPQVDLGPDQTVVTCGPTAEVDLVQLTGGPAGYSTWTFDGVSITSVQAQNASAAGVYQLVRSNGAGCSDTLSITLTVAGVFLGPDQTLSVCPGSPADLTALFLPVVPNASWTFGGQVFGAPEAASVPGIYTLTATDAQGCSDEAQVQLGWAAAPDLGPDGIIDICSNGTTDLTQLYDLGPGTGTSAWTLDGVTWVMPYAVNVPGAFQLVQTNTAGCSDTAVVTVTVYQAPSLGPDQVVNGCDGELVDLTGLYAMQGLPASWSLGGAAVSDASAVDEGGTYRLVVNTVEDCRDTAFVTITLHAAPVLGEDQELSICTGATADLEALYVAGSSTASWTLNGAAVADPGAAEGPGTYQLVLTNGHGCADTLLATVDVLPTPALGADVTVDRCAGDVVDLTALFPLAGLETAWTLNGAPLDTPEQVAWSGTYRVVVTNAAGCSDEAVVLLTIQPAPDLGPDLSFTLCPWQTVDLTTVLVLDGLTVDVSLDGALVDPGTPITDAGTYLVVGTNANGCTDSVWVEVGAVDCLCEADFVYEGACIQDPVAFTVLADSAVVGVRWGFAGAADAITGTAPVVRFSGSTTVQVTMEVTLSCGVVTVQRPIVVPDCSDLCKVYIANAFSPNNDGVNDVWSWNGECLPEAMDLVVMDRWGRVVFASVDPLARWDGSLGGTPVPPGVYAYRMRYRLPYQDERTATGSVSLLR
jgi:gliding motility-associated-like protein